MSIYSRIALAFLGSFIVLLWPFLEGLSQYRSTSSEFPIMGLFPILLNPAILVASILFVIYEQNDHPLQVFVSSMGVPGLTYGLGSIDKALVAIEAARNAANGG